MNIIALTSSYITYLFICNNVFTHNTNILYNCTLAAFASARLQYKVYSHFVYMYKNNCLIACARVQ